jgi:hypothetical protein
MAKLACTYMPGSDFEDEDGEPLPGDAPYDCQEPRTPSYRWRLEDR